MGDSSDSTTPYEKSPLTSVVERQGTEGSRICGRQEVVRPPNDGDVDWSISNPVVVLGYRISDVNDDVSQSGGPLVQR